MKLALPTRFDVDYPEENENYYTAPYSEIIKKKLEEASDGYCMYCGRKTSMEGESFGQLEHSVDKKGNKNQKKEDSLCLEHCKYNFALACPKCNMVYKKKIQKIDFAKWKDKKCFDTCTEMCSDYICMKELYTNQNQLLLQPHGYMINGEWGCIDFNLFKFLFEPQAQTKEPTLKFLIGNHIERFDLNGNRFSEAIVNICEDVVELFEGGMQSGKNIMFFLNRKKPYDNVIGNLFVDFLMDAFGEDGTEIYEFCKMELLLSITF